MPGCHIQGEGLEELIRNVKEAIELYLGTLTEEERGSFKVEGVQKVKASYQKITSPHL